MVSEDVFTFNFNTAQEQKEVLKRIAMLFDPLEFLASFIIRAKILMQEIWIVGVGWDDPEMNKKIKIWFDELKDLGRLKVPTYIRSQISLFAYICGCLRECIWSSCIC